MTDIVSPDIRSRMMAGIGAINTGPETALRRALHARGLRFRIHVRSLPGTPDIVLSRFKTACFVHGCFWHRHPGCRYASTPSTRQDFWQHKFRANVLRDLKVRGALLDQGWHVLVVWECSLRGDHLIDEVADEVATWLRQIGVDDLAV